MDLYADLDAINNHPERVRARQLRRQARQEAVHERIGEAIGVTRAFQAAVQWSLQSHDAKNAVGSPIGTQHPGVAGHYAVMKALSEFDIPTTYQVRYAGMKRFKGAGAHRMEDGIITMEVALRSMSGHQDLVDVPVIVKEGRVFEPVCLLYHQNLRALTQHTFDDILKRGTFKIKVPDRKNMYSRPPSDHASSRDVPLVRPGVYGVAPGNHQLRARKASLIKSAVSGHYVEALRDLDDAPDYTDWAERPQVPLGPGDEAKLTRGLDVPGRDGYRWHLEKGTKVNIVRDRDGGGTEFVVWPEGCSFQVVVPGDAIE